MVRNEKVMKYFTTALIPLIISVIVFSFLFRDYADRTHALKIIVVGSALVYVLSILINLYRDGLVTSLKSASIKNLTLVGLVYGTVVTLLLMVVGLYNVFGENISKIVLNSTSLGFKLATSMFPNIDIFFGIILTMVIYGSLGVIAVRLFFKK